MEQPYETGSFKTNLWSVQSMVVTVTAAANESFTFTSVMYVSQSIHA